MFNRFSFRFICQSCSWRKGSISVRNYVGDIRSVTAVAHFYNCVVLTYVNPKGLNKNVSNVFIHFFVDKFKMAATGHRMSYNTTHFNSIQFNSIQCTLMSLKKDDTFARFCLRCNGHDH